MEHCDTKNGKRDILSIKTKTVGEVYGLTRGQVGYNTSQ